MRQILIEKYVDSDEYGISSKYNFFAKFWINELGDLHSFLCHPALLYFSNNNGLFGELTGKGWYKKGVVHRDKNLPAEIFYKNGQIEVESWYKKGLKHRGGGLPAYIEYENGQINYQEWYENGKFIKFIKGVKY
jgi:hypothetical protein